jgi:hypothetical protein
MTAVKPFPNREMNRFLSMNFPLLERSRKLLERFSLIFPYAKSSEQVKKRSEYDSGRCCEISPRGHLTNCAPANLEVA